MNLKKLLLLMIGFATTASIAQSPAFEWATRFGGDSTDAGKSVFVDKTGNVYTTGNFKGTVDFDPGSGTYTLSAADTTHGDAFVSKQDASGNLLWAVAFGDTLSDTGSGIYADENGYVYTIGRFVGTVDFDPSASGTYTLESLYGTNFDDMFISKLDANGGFVWVKQFAGTNGTSIKLDKLGNIYTTGSFTGSADFDPGSSQYTLYSSHASEMFVSKLDNNGDFLWAKGWGGSQGGEALSLAVDHSGNVYTTGFFTDTVDFDPGVNTYTLTTASPEGPQAFISKLDANGDFVWAKQIGNNNFTLGTSLAVNDVGDVYVTGAFSGTVDFDPEVNTFTLTTGDDFVDQTFVLKLNTGGNFGWAKQLLSPVGSNLGQGITVDLVRNVYVTGAFQSTADFDPSAGTYSITANGDDAFVWKLDANGEFVWAKNWGASSKATSGTSIFVDQSGSVYTTGSFEGKVDLDPNAATFDLTSQGQSDIFVQKLSQSGFCVPPVPTNNTPLVNQTICPLNTTTLTASATGTGTISWYATPTSTLALITGSSYITPALSAGIYTYYAEEASTCTVNVRTAITVTVSAPTFNVNSGAICMGNSYTLTPNGVNTYTYSYSGGAAVVSPTIMTSYTITGTDAIGCSASSTISVAVNVLPEISIITSNTLMCSGQSVVLTALTITGINTYTWGPSGTVSNSISVSPTETTTYNVVGTDANGCSNTATFTQSVTVCNALREENDEAYGISIFPNPATEMVSVAFLNNYSGNEDNEKQVQVINALGQVVINQSAKTPTLSIPIQQLPVGVYVIKSSQQSQSHTTRFIKQ